MTRRENAINDVSTKRSSRNAIRRPRDAKPYIIDRQTTTYAKIYFCRANERNLGLATAITNRLHFVPRVTLRGVSAAIST